MWCWGYNADGPLGQGDANTRYVPTRVGTDTDWSKVSAGFAHTCAIKINGKQYCWGHGGDGRLGLNNTTEQTTPQKVDTATDWSRLGFSRWANGGGTCAIKTTGTLWC